MSDKYKIDDKEGIYFVTLTAVDWVDIFTRRELKITIIDSLKYCQQNKGLIIYAWCLMHSHLHMIVGTKAGFDLSAILRDMKKHTAKEIIKKINDEPESRREWMLHRFEYAGKYLKRIKNYKVWQDGNQAKQIITSEFMKQKLDYIHNNPVEEMIVAEPQHYLFSSAMNYASEKGLIDVELVF
ncbi:MAG TPA: transposase [Bacteroidia bacterium]